MRTPKSPIHLIAPIDCRCLARERAKGLDFVVISVVKYGRSTIARLSRQEDKKDK